MAFNKVLKYTYFLLIVTILIAIYGFSVQRNNTKKITQIAVEFEAGENNFLTHDMVNKLLIQNDSTVKNQAKSIVDLYTLEGLVYKNPYVQKADVFLTLDGHLKSVIKQRVPVARIVTENTVYYVDSDGVNLPLSKVFSARVPLVSGIESAKDLEAILPLILEVKNDSFLTKEVVGIAKNAKDEFELSVRSGAYKIDLGTLEHLSIKIKKLKAFYNATFKDNVINNFKKISLKYHNQVVCTK